MGRRCRCRWCLIFCLVIYICGCSWSSAMFLLAHRYELVCLICRPLLGSAAWDWGYTCLCAPERQKRWHGYPINLIAVHRNVVRVPSRWRTACRCNLVCTGKQENRLTGADFLELTEDQLKAQEWQFRGWLHRLIAPPVPINKLKLPDPRCM